MAGVLKTHMPASSDAVLERLVHNKEVRRNNLKALRESMDAEQIKKDVKKEVEEAGKDSGKAKERVESDLALEAYAQQTARQRATIGRAGLKERLVTEGISLLWDKVLFETAYNASWVDSKVKETLMEPMFESYCEIMEAVSEITPEAITKSPNRFLQEVHRIVVETAEEAADRICDEYDSDTDPQKNPDKLDFSLTDTEEEQFSKDIAEMSPEEIEEAVKNKVLTVVQDEKQASKEKAEKMEEIDEAKKDEDEEEESEEDEDDSSDDDSDDSDDESDEDDSSEEEDEDSSDEDGSEGEDDDSDEEGDEDDEAEDESDDDAEEDEESDSKSKKKGKSKSKKPEEEPVEEAFFDPAPKDFYETVAKLYTKLYAAIKGGHGANHYDSVAHIAKGGNADVTNVRSIQASKAKSFTRQVDISTAEAEKIVSSQGFKRGATKTMCVGHWFCKELQSGGYAEAAVYESQVADSTSVGTGAGVDAYGNAAMVSGSTVNYVRKTYVKVAYHATLSKGMKDRYLFEGNMIIDAKTPLMEAEELRIGRMVREINHPKNISLFEALMINARATTQTDALLEGIDIPVEEMMDVSMVSAVTDYTIMETLNTIGLCDFNSVTTSKLKESLMESAADLLKKTPKLMSLDEAGKKKKVRIGTKKFKINKDKKVLAADTDSKGKKRKSGFTAKFSNAFKGKK